MTGVGVNTTGAGSGAFACGVAHADFGAGVAPRSVKTGFCTITGAGAGAAGGADCSGFTVTGTGRGAAGEAGTSGRFRGAVAAGARGGTVTAGRSSVTTDSGFGTSG